MDAIAKARLLAVISASSVKMREYVAQRARGTNNASICQPHCAFAFSEVAHYSNSIKENGRLIEPCSYCM